MNRPERVQVRCIPQKNVTPERCAVQVVIVEPKIDSGAALLYHQSFPPEKAAAEADRLLSLIQGLGQPVDDEIVRSVR